MNFDFNNLLHQLYPVGQLVSAIVLGGLIGWQRGLRGKAAGARTYALVTAGSTLFTILSMLAFDKESAVASSRMVAQIVTGIGFLGAGVILHKEDRTVGLTTAAGLWMSAAIGMAIGLGFYVLAIASSILILIVLMSDDTKWVKSHGHDRDHDNDHYHEHDQLYEK